jgi:hypothetical protein
MLDQNKDPFYERYLVPYALFLGISVSFGVCSVAGIRSSRCNLFSEFERFHTYINIATLFHPTASQVRSLGRAKLDPDKIVVVVGGNSVLYGTGQRPEHVWTRKLQSLLGDRYQVINFATPGAQLTEFGGTAAEILSRDYARLIVLTNVSPASPAADPDGHSLYRFVFWDAYYKNLLTPDDAREKRLAELAEERKNLSQFSEMKTQMRLDHFFYFRDLWTTLAYTHVATIWTHQVGSAFLKPRRHYRDPDQEVPPERCGERDRHECLAH